MIAFDGYTAIACYGIIIANSIIIIISYAKESYLSIMLLTAIMVIQIYTINKLYPHFINELHQAGIVNASI